MKPPYSKLRGMRAELRRSLTRFGSKELRRGSPRLHVGSKPWAKNDYPGSKLQGIQAEANKNAAAWVDKTIFIVISDTPGSSRTV